MEANLIPFNWDLHQTGKYNVVTRDGRLVNGIVNLNHNVLDYPIRGKVKNGMEEAWTLDGYWQTSNIPNELDIFLVAKEGSHE